MEYPIGYKEQAFTSFANMQPSAVKAVWNAETDYHKRYLWMQVYSVFNFNLPKEWDLGWFRFWLFRFGSIAVIYTYEEGWIAYPYTIEKLDLYYRPKVIRVTSPYLRTDKAGYIGKNAEVVHIFDDFYSIADLVERYAQKLANIDKSIDIALMNSNIAMVFEAENKKQADTIKEAYAKATTGEPMVTINKDAIGDGFKTLLPSVGQNYIVDKLLSDRRKIVNEFLTKVGIRNANYDKKERLNSQEVNENNDETKSIISNIFTNISIAFEKINKISDLNLSIAYAYDYSEDQSGEEVEAVA